MNLEQKNQLEIHISAFTSRLAGSKGAGAMNSKKPLSCWYPFLGAKAGGMTWKTKLSITHRRESMQDWTRQPSTDLPTLTKLLQGHRRAAALPMGLNARRTVCFPKEEASIFLSP